MSCKAKKFLRPHKVSFEDMMKLTKRIEKKHEMIESFELKIKKSVRSLRKIRVTRQLLRASFMSKKILLDKKFNHTICITITSIGKSINIKGYSMKKIHLCGTSHQL